MRVLLDGYYGMRNVGDDAFCVVTSRIGASAWGDTSLAALARPGHLPAMTQNLEAVLPQRPRFRGHQRIASAIQMMRADQIVHAGGSTLSAMNRHFSDQLLISRAKPVGLHALSISVGPFRNTTDAIAVSQFLGHFQTVSIRDRESESRLREAKFAGHALNSFDIAVLLPSLMPAGLQIEPGDSQPVLGVSVCSFERFQTSEDTHDEERRNEELLELLRRVARSTSAALRFIVFNSHPEWGDQALSEWFAARLARETRVNVVGYNGDLSVTLGALRGCSAVIGMRLHASVLAYALGIPLAVVGYHSKCSDFANEIGLPPSLILPRVGLDPDRAEDLACLVTSPPGQKPTLPVAEASARALAAFDLLPWHQPSRVM